MLFASLSEFGCCCSKSFGVLYLALNSSLIYECWLVTMYSRGSLCISLHFSFSLQLSTHCWSSLWPLVTLASLDSQLHFLNLGRPQALPGFLLPVPQPANSQGSKLGKYVAHVICSLSPRITVIHYFLSKIFSAVVSYILLGFIISCRRLDLVLFTPSWLVVVSFWFYFPFS